VSGPHVRDPCYVWVVPIWGFMIELCLRAYLLTFTNLQISGGFAPTQTLIMSLLSCLSASSRLALRAPQINTVSMQRRNVMIEYVKQLKNGKLEDPMYVSLRSMVLFVT